MKSLLGKNRTRLVVEDLSCIRSETELRDVGHNYMARV